MFKLLAVLALVLQIGCADSAPSRGVSNNNPGNLVKTSIPWQGKVQCADPTFECFSDAYFGVRAMTKTLITYKEKYNLNTVQGIITRWSPSYENDTASFINFVVHRVGGITDDFYSKLPHLVFTMVHFENGTSPYSFRFIKGVVNDTIRDSHPTRLDSPRWCNETILQEDGERETEARQYDVGSGSYARRAAGDTGSQERQVYMDEEIHSSYSSPLRIRPTEAGTFLRPRRGVWMDGVQSRVHVLYRW